jgi:tetratricopeptide (TPR) repeat protein
MKKILFAIIFCSLAVGVVAQDDVDQLHENAKTFMRQGDYANATLILTRALQQNPNDASIIKDLALTYYLQKENQKALTVIKPLIDNQNADDQTYQITATIYRALNQDKEAEKIYKQAIK